MLPPPPTSPTTLTDIIVNGFVILSTIVATLRASSRLLYITQHGSIGIMDGPLILPPSSTNATEISPLYELSENFKHCVRLSVVPDLYDNVHEMETLLG